MKWILSFFILCFVFSSHSPRLENSDAFEGDNENMLHASKGMEEFNLTELYEEEYKVLDKDIETVVTWNTLKNVRYEEKPDPTYKVVYKPIYGKSIRDLEDKTIQIKGFIIPITSNTFALSKNPFAACFFCGQAGPETVMGIQFRKLKDKLKTDMFVTLKGKFILNYDNPDDWMYHIIDAEIIEIK